MTTEGIKAFQGTAINTDFWLAEIAYQLAVLNERNAAGDTEAVNAMLGKVGLFASVLSGTPETASSKEGTNQP